MLGVLGRVLISDLMLNIHTVLESFGHIFAITNDEDYIQNLDKQAKLRNLPARLTIRVRTQTRQAQTGLEKQIDLLVYKLYNLTPAEIAIVEGNK